MTEQRSLFASPAFDALQPHERKGGCSHPAASQFLNRDLFSGDWNMTCGAIVAGEQCGAIVAVGYRAIRGQRG